MNYAMISLGITLIGLGFLIGSIGSKSDDNEGDE